MDCHKDTHTQPLLCAVSVLLSALIIICACRAGHDPLHSWLAQPTIGAGGAALEQLISWPASGAELVVRFEDRDGFPRPDLHAGAVKLRWMNEHNAQPISVSRVVPGEQGYTLLLLLPATTSEDAQNMALAVSAFVASRPPGEEVAIYRWGKNVEQLANFSRDRADIARVIGRIPLRAAGAPVLSPAAALRQAALEVARAGNPVLLQSRHVIIIGHELPGALPDAKEQDTGTIVQWVLKDLSRSDAAAAALGRGRVVPWEPNEDLRQALTRAGERLDAFRQAYYRIGVCGIGDGKIAVVEALANDDGHDKESWLHVRIPPSLPEERDGVCDPHAISAGTRPYPDTIELILDEKQQAAYRDRQERESRQDFSLSVRLWPGSTPVKARAHLRGDGTFDCDRRNYTIKFRDKRPRYLMPGLAADKFYLISMCAEEYYIKAFTAYQLMSRLGLFPLAFRYIEVRLNGESQGVYLLIEKPQESLVGRNGGVRSVIRRRYEPDRTAPEVKYAAAGQEAALSGYYQALQALIGKSGDALVQSLEEHLDLHGYLGFLAFHSLLQNGDYADEVWMLSTDRLRENGAIGDWFSFVGWDPDDVFSECHYEGQYALADHYGLSFCAEAELDDRILTDAKAYARYVDRLDQVLADITDETFTHAVKAAQVALQPYLRRPAIAAVMLGLPEDDDALALETLSAEIASAAKGLIETFQRRRQLLQQRVARYRSAESRAADSVLTEERAPAPGSQGQ